MVQYGNELYTNRPMVLNLFQRFEINPKNML